MASWWENLIRMWQDRMGADFFSGYWLAVALMGTFILLWFLVHLIIWLCWRRRRVSAVSMPQPDGAVEVSAQAIFRTARDLEPEFPVFQIEDIRLYRRRRNYSLRLRFKFQSDSDGLAESVAKFKKRLCEQLDKRFRLTSIRMIDIRLEPRDDEESSEGKPRIDEPLAPGF